MNAPEHLTAPAAGTYQRLFEARGELVALRRELHTMPELGFEEHRTAARIVQALKACGVDEIHQGLGRTGIVATIHGQRLPGEDPNAKPRLIGLRADMDALPLREQNDVPWRSSTPGLMHACGHDGHCAMLVGTARHLAQTRRFAGTAVLVFQPGEEGYGGAREMIADGLFDRFPVESIYAMHNWPHLPPGKIGLNRGAMMAAADRVNITIQGRGGHGAHPHLSVDPVLIAGHIITAVQSLVSRNIAPIEQAVVSLCSMQAGEPSAFSVIPEMAQLTGTVRSFKPEVQQLLEERMSRLVESVALGFGASAKVDYQRLYPATVNSAREADFAVRVAQSLVGSENVDDKLVPSMGSEDFAFMLQARPGAYLRLGQGGPCGLHQPRYDFNDEILPLGSALFAALVEQGLPLPASSDSPAPIPA